MAILRTINLLSAINCDFLSSKKFKVSQVTLMLLIFIVLFKQQQQIDADDIFTTATATVITYNLPSYYSAPRGQLKRKGNGVIPKVLLQLMSNALRLLIDTKISIVTTGAFSILIIIVSVLAFLSKKKAATDQDGNPSSHDNASSGQPKPKDSTDELCKCDTDKSKTIKLCDISPSLAIIHSLVDLFIDVVFSGDEQDGRHETMFWFIRLSSFFVFAYIVLSLSLERTSKKHAIAEVLDVMYYLNATLIIAVVFVITMIRVDVVALLLYLPHLFTLMIVLMSEFDPEIRWAIGAIEEFDIWTWIAAHKSLVSVFLVPLIAYKAYHFDTRSVMKFKFIYGNEFALFFCSETLISYLSSSMLSSIPSKEAGLRMAVNILKFFAFLCGLLTIVSIGYNSSLTNSSQFTNVT